MRSRIPFEPAAHVPAAPVCDDREVHLWAASLVQPPEELARLRRLLSVDELARADRFRAPHHQQRHVAAHGLLREMLGAYDRRPAELLEFDVGTHGKPALVTADRARPLHFNLSHSGDHLLVGIAREELGVDLEVIRPGLQFLRLADRYFTPAEAETLRSVPKSQQPEAFYTLWTRKEAYVKALGTGLSEGLNVSNPAGRSVCDLRPAPDLVGALVIRGDGWQIRAFSLLRNAG